MGSVDLDQCFGCFSGARRPPPPLESGVGKYCRPQLNFWPSGNPLGTHLQRVQHAVPAGVRRLRRQSCFKAVRRSEPWPQAWC